MVGDLAALGLHKVQGALVDRRQPLRRRLRAAGLRSEERLDRLARAVVGGVARTATSSASPSSPAPRPARPRASSSIRRRPTSRSRDASSPPPAARPRPASTPRRTATARASTSAGRIKLGADPRTFYRRVAQPSLFLGQTLQAAAASGAESPSASVRVGAAPAQGLRVLATHDSAPLAVVVQDLNKRSNNFAAEQLLRTLGAEIGGRPGNWDKGLEAVARYLGGIGIKADSYQMKNGSGLYDSNRFSAAQIVTILRAAAHDFRISAEFLASLAVAGTDGTIAHRMGGTLAERYVRAKTGTLANVSCLSGFAGSPGHLPLVFSILVNDVGEPERRAARAGPRRGDPGRLPRRRRRREVAGRTRRPALRAGAPAAAAPRLAAGSPWPLAEQLRLLLRCQLLPPSSPAPLIHRIHPIGRTRTDVTQLHLALPGDAHLCNPDSTEENSRQAGQIEHQFEITSDPRPGAERRPRRPRPVSLLVPRLVVPLVLLPFSSLSRISMRAECFRILSAPPFVRYFAASGAALRERLAA